MLQGRYQGVQNIMTTPWPLRHPSGRKRNEMKLIVYAVCGSLVTWIFDQRSASTRI